MFKIGHIQIKRIEATVAFNCSQAPIDADAHKLQRWQQAAKWSRETLICKPTNLRLEQNRTPTKKRRIESRRVPIRCSLQWIIWGNCRKLVEGD